MSALAGVLNSDPANITVAIHVQQGVLVQVPGLCDFGWPKLNVKRVCVLKVLNFHGLNGEFSLPSEENSNVAHKNSLAPLQLFCRAGYRARL